MEYVGEKELNNKLNDFKNHLEHADRMILSAKFGDGKSFFLQKVREDAELFSDYEFITIYPVNYIVSSNEDIFEYIKRDIIIQLTELGLLNKIDLNKLITSVFSFENFKGVISFLISCIPGGSVYNKLLDKAFEISKKYSAEKATYEKYFGTFNQQKGGLYEDDIYTQMIKEALNLLKNGYTDGRKEIKKKPVLIIEDLDRLDPAHLFRILNVISAHIDDSLRPDKVGNKFGFSNIVIVMDFDATQHIFEHFYGKDASYTGYMSKFLSEEPFRYSITDLALPKLKEKIQKEVGISMDFFKAFRILNLKLSLLSMRDIVRLYDFDISIRIHKSALNTYEGNLSTQMPIFKLLIYMTELGMSCSDIDDDLSLKTKYNHWEYLKLTFPLRLMSKGGTMTIFELGHKCFQVSLKKEDDIINKIDIVDYNYIPEKTSFVSSLNEKSALYCQLLAEYIDFSNLNCCKKFTIPNYSPVS